MRHPLRPFSWGTTALVIAVIGATNCDSDRRIIEPAAPVPYVIAVEILGPNTIPPGTTAKFSVRSKWSTGEIREILHGVNWQTSNPEVLSIDSSGTATARERGTSTIKAAMTGTPGATVMVSVLPDGTFRLFGKVSDTTTAGVPIQSALVEADSDSGKVTAMTSARGEFSLHGVRGDAQLRVSRNGYRVHEQRLNLTADATVDIALTLVQPRLMIAGTYVLSVGSPQCEGASPPLAEAWRQRTYTALVMQNDARVTVRLSGGQIRSDTFFGVVTGTSVTFDLTDGDYYYSLGQDVVEQLPNGTFLVITGYAITVPTASGLAGTLNGSLINAQRLPLVGLPLGSCPSGSHAFTLTR